MEDMLRQTIFKEVQFFILDCASPDNEAETILPYAKQHSNIIYKRLDEDPGLYPAWNFCIQNTEGDFLTNWNVDDRKTPWSLEIMRDSLVLNSDIENCNIANTDAKFEIINLYCKIKNKSFDEGIKEYLRLNKINVKEALSLDILMRRINNEV